MSGWKFWESKQKIYFQYDLNNESLATDKNNTHAILPPLSRFAVSTIHLEILIINTDFIFQQFPIVKHVDVNNLQLTVLR